MSKKMLKCIAILLMVAIVVVGFVSPAFAAKDIDVGSFDDYDGGDATKSAKRIVGALIDVFQVVGVGVAIIMLVMLAIKYLSAAPNEKAEIKKSVSIYVLGAVLLFAASGVLEIIQQFADNVGKNAAAGGNSGGSAQA